VNARALVLLGLAAFAGVALAAPGADTRGEGVDPPDRPADPVGVLDQALGDYGPSAIIDAVDAITADGNTGDAMSAQALTTAGLGQLKREEGYSPTPYPDHKGNSIGYGHLIKPGENLTYLTEPQAADLLAQDVAWAEAAVIGAVRVPLTPSQFDALVSFCFNVGASAFRGSTLVRKLNAGDTSGATAEFPRWNRASGAVLQSLVDRRDREQSLFESGAYA
jgi:lysozyme